MWKHLNYNGVILLTTPFVCLATIIGIVELVMGLDGNVALIIVKPFLWAKERKISP
jgi:hypothetical protein